MVLDALPPIADRSDTKADQIRDLIEVAHALRMSEAVPMLQSLLSSIRYIEPKPIHPEQEACEIHLCNLEPEGARVVGWKTKRIGVIAYTSGGHAERNKVPVFVQADEFKAAGQWDARYSIKE
jgi:hypothetical protein